MIQKRENPLELKKDEPVEAEVKTVKEEKKPDEVKKTAPKVQAQKPVINSADFKHDFKKRENPLELNKEKEVKNTEAKLKPIILPVSISGKNQRKFILTKVNNTLLTSLISKTNMKKPELLEAALLQYAFNNEKDLYTEILKDIKEKGGEVK